MCLEVTLVKNPPTDLLKSLGTSGHLEGTMDVLSDEQRTKLLDAVGKNPDSKLLSQKVTMFYGTHGSIEWAPGPGPKENETLDLEIADSTDRYAVNLKFGLHDNKTGKVTARPAAVSVANQKTVAIEFNRTQDERIGEGGPARPSLLVVRPRLLFPIEEEEVRQ